MKSPDGKPLTIGISVDGGQVVAYACNGTDDEAWFFGKQTDGTIDLESKFRDALNARFDGTDVDGDVTGQADHRRGVFPSPRIKTFRPRGAVRSVKSP